MALNFEKQQSTTAGVSRAAVFMQQVYTWMFAALMLTAGVAFVVSSVPAFRGILFNPIIMIGLMFGLIGFVWYLSSRINTLSPTTATNMFLGYAALNGVVLSPILLVYTGASVASTFVIASLMFGSLALYGMTTKRDLSPMGQFMIMGAIGLFIAMIVNFFLQSSAMQFVINVAGVIIFAGLTAYDNQKIREMGESAPLDDATAIRRGAILGALTLYLDFINLFLFLLRLLGVARGDD